jgi:hypothetical protein
MRGLVGLVLTVLLGAAIWWLAAGEGTPVSAQHPGTVDRAAMIARAASVAPAGLMPAASHDPWALLRRAEAAKADKAAADAETGPLLAELQKKTRAWLDPAKDAAWCEHMAPAQLTEVNASDELGDELTLELARQQVFIRWINVLVQRGDGRSMAAADYLQAQAQASLGELPALRSEPLQRRALNSQDGRVLALAAHMSCQPVHTGCQAVLSRWLQLEPANEQALSWQLDLLLPESSERLSALTRLAHAQRDADSQRVWAELFASLPRSASSGLRQMAEQSALESLHWAGSASMSPSWAMVCREDKRPATEAACAKLAERLWQSESANLMEKMQAVAVGKRLGANGLDWVQREQTIKAAQAAGTRAHQDAVADLGSARSCAGVAARHDWQQKLAREGEWRSYSELAAQPVLRSPAAIPLIDK